MTTIRKRLMSGLLALVLALSLLPAQALAWGMDMGDSVILPVGDDASAAGLQMADVSFFSERSITPVYASSSALSVQMPALNVPDGVGSPSNARVQALDSDGTVVARTAAVSVYGNGTLNNANLFFLDQLAEGSYDMQLVYGTADAVQAVDLDYELTVVDGPVITAASIGNLKTYDGVPASAAQLTLRVSGYQGDPGYTFTLYEVGDEGAGEIACDASIAQVRSSGQDLTEVVYQLVPQTPLSTEANVNYALQIDVPQGEIYNNASSVTTTYRQFVPGIAILDISEDGDAASRLKVMVGGVTAGTGYTISVSGNSSTFCNETVTAAQTGNETFSVSLSKNGVELPAAACGSRLSVSVRTEGSSDSMSYTVSESGGGSQYTRLTLTKQPDGACAFTLMGVNLLLDLYEADPLPAFQLWTYDRSAGNYVLAGTASDVSRDIYNDNRAVCCEFTGTINAVLAENTYYVLRRADTGEELAAGRFSTGSGGDEPLTVHSCYGSNLRSDSFAFSFGMLPFTAYLGGCGAEVTAELVDVTGGEIVAASGQGTKVEEGQYSFQIAQPAEFDPSHSYSLRFTSGGQTAYWEDSGNRRQMACDSEVGNFYPYVDGSVYAGAREVTFRVSPYNCKNLPADYLETNPISLVQSGAEIGASVTGVAVEYDGNYYMIRLTLRDPLAAGTYSYYYGTRSSTFTVLPSDAASIGYGSRDADGALSITGCQNLPEGTYTGTLYEQNAWQNGGKPVLEDMQLTRVDAGTLKTNGLSDVPSGSYYLEIAVDGSYLGTAFVSWTQSGVSITGYAVDEATNRTTVISYLTTASTIQIQTILPGYAYVRYALGVEPTGEYQPVRESYEQTLALGADGEKTVYVQFRKADGTESQVYTWKCKKVASLETPAFVSVSVLVDGMEAHVVPENTKFTLRAVASSQLADVSVKFKEADGSLDYSQTALAYKGETDGGYLFEAELNSRDYQFTASSGNHFTHAVFSLSSFLESGSGRDVETKEYELTFAGQKPIIVLDDWSSSGQTVYTNQFSYTVTGTATPNSTVTVTWGLPQYSYGTPDESKTRSQTAEADADGRFSATLTGLEVRERSQSCLVVTDSEGLTTDPESYYSRCALVVDTTPPVVSNLRASVTPNSDNSAAITWTVEDANRSYCLLWRDGVLIDGHYQSYNYIALRAENTEYTVQAVDMAGNVSEPQTIRIRGDEEDPTVTVSENTPKEGSLGGTARLTVAGTAADNKELARVELQYSLDNGITYTPADSTRTFAGESGAWSVTFDAAKDLPSGSVTVKAVAYDASGNTAEAAVGTYTLDNTPPAAPAYFFVGSTDGVNIELEWTHDKGEEDFDHFNVYRSDAEDGTFYRIANDVTERTYRDSKAYTGLNYYYVTAVDKLGNESEHTEILSGENTKDEQAPVIRFITPADGDMIRVTGADGETITVQIEAADNYKLGSCTVSYGADKTQTLVPEHPTKTHTYVFEIPVSDLGGSPFSLTITVADAGGRTAQKTVTYKKYTPPAAPANLEAEPTGHKQVELTWTYSGSTDMLNIFAVYRSEDGENFEYAGSVPAVSGQTAYSYVDTVEFTAQSKEYTYRVDAVDKVLEEGTTSSMVTVTAVSQDAEAPVAVITPAHLTALAGTPFSLSGAASTDNDRIVSYRWDFGDGGTATGADTAHAYAAAGEHTVTLTVTDASGRTGTAECTVDVLKELRESDTLATFFVCDAQTRAALHSAELALVLTDETGSQVFPDALRTGEDGTVTAVLPNGRYRINVSHPDYNARSIWVELSGGVQRIPDIGLGGALRGELKHEVLSLEEIKAAGIDVNAPGNQHVVKFEFTFGFGAEAIVYDVYRNEYGIVKIPDRVDGPGCVIYPISEKFALVVYGEAHWLKEMFKVELVVFNDSLTDELNDVTAALTLPDGLSLADMVAGTQTAEQALGNIKGGGQAAAVWYLRGDTAGEYDLSATVKAVSMPFGEPVRETFTTKDKLKVYAGDALHMTIIPDAIARRGEDYHVRFRLTNTTEDRTVNNFSFTVTQAKQYNITKTDHVTVEKLADETYGGSAFSVNVTELAPGESVEVDFSTTIQFNSVLELLKVNRPGRFVDVYYLLRDVWVSTLAGSTTSIPWSVEVNTDVRWPVHWETAEKYHTLYGELLETPTYELLKRYVEVEEDAPLEAIMGEGGQIVLALDENGELDGARMFIRGARVRSGGDSLDTEVLSGIVSKDGRKLTIQAKAPGTQTVEFGVADSNGQTVNSWIYEITVSGSSGDGAETTESLSGSGSVYEITEEAWTSAVENKREAEIEKLNEDPYQSFNSILTWTLEDTGTDGYQVTTAPGSIQELLDRTAVTHMCIQGGAAALTFDREALKKLAETQEGAVEIAVKHLDTDEAQALGGNRPTYAFAAGGAAAQVTVPYAPQSGDSFVYVECLDGEGRVTKVIAAIYDSAARTVSFTVDGSSAYFRIAATNVPAAGEGYAINFRAETVSANGGFEVSRDADFTRILAAGDTIIPGERLYVRTAADAALGIPAGPALEILVPERPAAPAVTAAATTDAASADGKIMGVTPAMEYSADGAAWTACPKTEVAALAAGTYQIRLKASGSAFAGYAAFVVVRQGSGTGPVEPSDPVIPDLPVDPVTPVVPVYPVRPGNSGSSPSSGNSNVPSGSPVEIPDSSIPLESPGTVWSNPFNDVQESAWYYDAVRFVSENGLMAGVSAGVFDHSANMTRAMLAQILYNKEEQPAVGSGGVFTDVAAGTWYYRAITWAAENRIVSGYGNGIFGPNDQITREQLVTMLWRYAGSPAAAVKELNFTDAGEISAYALEAVCWAVEKGIINGIGGNLLDPQGLATRAQAAQMLKNYLEI